MKKLIVLANNIGICNNCFILIISQGPPTGVRVRNEKCQRCGAVLKPKDFGYKKVNDGWMKLKWVGKYGWWTGQQPSAGFKVGRWKVEIRIQTKKIKEVCLE